MSYLTVFQYSAFYPMYDCIEILKIKLIVLGADKDFLVIILYCFALNAGPKRPFERNYESGGVS